MCTAKQSEKGWQDPQRPQGWPQELQLNPPSSIRGSRRSRPKGPHPVRLEARRKPSRRCAWCVVVKREKRKLSTGGLCLTNDLTDHTGNNRAQTRPDSHWERQSPDSPSPDFYFVKYDDICTRFRGSRPKGPGRALRADFCKPLPGRTVHGRPSVTREKLQLSSRGVDRRARIFEICSQSYTASRGVLSAGKDQGTAGGARHDGWCQSFLDQNGSGAISAQARSCMIVFYR